VAEEPTDQMSPRGTQLLSAPSKAGREGENKYPNCSLFLLLRSIVSAFCWLNPAKTRGQRSPGQPASMQSRTKKDRVEYGGKMENKQY
jgi:hypothetical protein